MAAAAEALPSHHMPPAHRPTFRCRFPRPHCSLGHPGTPLVLEETAGSYGGGCGNITDTFLSGFTYLQTLAVAA
jgi:hypothetical protein